MTPSAQFVEKLDSWKQKAPTGNFAMFENLAAAAGDEVNVDIASKVVQQLGQVCEEFLLYFLEIIKTNLDLVKNLFVPVENVTDCMQDKLGTILKPSSKLIQFVIFG